MEIIPAIDIREGACARVLGDVPPEADIYAENPLEQAIIMRELGAEWVHITDLDGAFSGHLCNLHNIQEIVELSGVKVQHSGGIRSLEHIGTLLAMGVSRVVLGASVLRNQSLVRQAYEKFGDQVIPGVDGRDGDVSIEGFETTTSTTVPQLLEELGNIGFSRAIYTDLRRYGTMRGPDMEAIRQVLASSKMKTWVAGGIANYDMIQQLKAAGDVEGLIIGKAIYTGAINLKEALAIAKA
ncbi:MAG: 1-(5-phosphoribosyl)-5-((5-phosphoribosylamino)methylideneamino)imidazole-4-carboxamide isomerase [Firmicutes bacterium]|nr:1-(5-phosphoribosyl)-5-((5-phosphoribosylamino)methylideneamino)imidazole-4-carboxamide isomerase [Bacillota bacterium]